MLNMTNMLTSRQTFRVELTRKPTTNEGQNIRRQVEYVKAHDKAEARRIALDMPHNAKLTGAGGFIACVRVERRVMPFNWRRDMKAKHCDKCKHATTRETPKPTLICAVLHKPRFYAPVYWLKDTWGWKRNCDDYEELMLKHKIALDNV